MGLRELFRRRRQHEPVPGASANPPGGNVTPGGSRIYRHTETQARSLFGFSEEDTLPHIEQREAVYAELFGEDFNVNHELIPMVPHLDVYIFEPTEQRPFYTLITGGMSDVPMTIPDELDEPGELRRSELLLYANENKPEYAQLLRFLARMPHEFQTWLGPGHTVPNGDPPKPFFEKSKLTTALLLPPIVEEDQGLRERLTIKGDPVNPYWVTFLTDRETNLKLRRGTEAILNLFERRRHPFVLKEQRRSYV
ncbi:MAG: suppressor of fused domain protein [Sumerlaeia bacterium]